MSIAELSIRRPITTIMCFVSLVVVGLIASFRLPLEALPDISRPPLPPGVGALALLLRGE